MARIGTFKRTKAGISGRIRTLALDAQVILISIDNGDAENAPDYRIHLGDVGGSGRHRAQCVRALDLLRPRSSDVLCKSRLAAFAVLIEERGSSLAPLVIFPAIDVGSALSRFLLCRGGTGTTAHMRTAQNRRVRFSVRL